MTDEQLLRRLQTRQPGAPEAMMEKYYRYIYTVVGNIIGGIGSHEDIEELTQDTFYAVWEHADRIHGRLRPYLSTTARNKAKSWLRGRRKIPMDLDTIDIPDPDSSPEAAITQKELAKRITQAVDRMRPTDREIFIRCYYYLQSTETIAQRMGLSPNAVRTRLTRGRKALKKQLDREGLL